MNYFFMLHVLQQHVRFTNYKSRIINYSFQHVHVNHDLQIMNDDSENIFHHFPRGFQVEKNYLLWISKMMSELIFIP